MLAQRYDVVEQIGSGAAKDGHARPKAGGADVAIAVLPLVDRFEFEREVAMLRGITCEHVPAIHESRVDERGFGYIVMERCDGPSLASLVRADGMAMAEAAPLLVAFARGLAAIHATCSLHRDVKLENVMLTSRGDATRVVFLDFGIAARAASVTTAVTVINLAGTLPHLPREALRGEAIDARADVYAFAVSAFRLLVGELPLPPHDDETEFGYLERLRKIERHDVSRLVMLPAPLRALFARMLSADRAQRPFMPEVGDVLARHLGDAARAPIATWARRPAPRLALARQRRARGRGLRLEQVLVAPCAQVPIVAIANVPDAAIVRAYRDGGALVWTRYLDRRITAGVRVDLDDRMSCRRR